MYAGEDTIRAVSDVNIFQSDSYVSVTFSKIETPFLKPFHNALDVVENPPAL